MVIASRHHLVVSYAVLPSVDPGWSALAAPPLGALFALVGATALGVALIKLRGADRSAAERWLMLAWLVPAADLARIAVPQLPVTLVEPLALAFVTSRAAARFSWDLRPWCPPRMTAVLVVTAALLVAAWLFAQSDRAFRDYLIGFNDFGQFILRIDNTWAGRGLLLEAPGLPPFWDHFNPGLLLLVPAWGLCPDVRMVFAVQAACLAAPALFVFAIARRLQASAPSALGWAIAYLCYPAVSQMNLNYTYGWHPVSLALPLLFAGAWALVSGRLVAAAILAMLAASFQEDVIMVLALFAATMAVWGWQAGRRSGSEKPLGPLSPRTWAIVSAVAFVAFAGVFWFSGFRPYQTSRFANLGGSTVEIVLSPLLRPDVFWGEVLRPRSFYYLAALWIPLGIAPLVRGRWILAATAVPLAVLLAWNHAPATSIAFQYATALIPVFFLAAIHGAAPDPVGAASPSNAALAASAAASTLAVALGALPFSSPTLTDVHVKTYPVVEGRHVLQDRREGSAAAAMLDQIIPRIHSPESSVLATGRIAAHLLGVRRLETVGQAAIRREFLQDENGRPIGVRAFDWILIDTLEHFQQSPAESQRIIDEAIESGFAIIEARHGIVLLRQPSDARP